MQASPPASNDVPAPGAAWLAAPAERSAEFFAAFLGVSLAIQAKLRERIPAAYFHDISSYANVKTAYPMLIYQASPPFRGKLRSELCYDVLNPATLAALFRNIRPIFPGILETVSFNLRSQGAAEIAALYEPRHASDILQSVQQESKSRKCLYILIRAEGVLVNSLVDLAGLSGSTERQQARRIAAFQKKWRYQLRRMLCGADFTWLAPELLEAATQALAAALQAPAETPGEG